MTRTSAGTAEVSDADDRGETAALPATRSAPRRLVPGLTVVTVAAGLAVTAGSLVPIIGAPVLAIGIGMALGPLARRLGWPVASGARFAGRYVLQAAIVVFGSGLSLGAVAQVGLASLPVMLGTLTACLGMAWLAGRALRVPGDLRALIASGTGICGASAIGAVAPVIAASEASVAYAMSTIFVFNLVAVVLFPVVGHLLGLGAHAFGLWAGTAVNDTSSVAAAGYAFGRAAGDYAVMVKLTRALMIIPVVLAAAALARRRATAGATPASPAPVRLHRIVPAFIPMFLLAAAANTVGVVPRAAHSALGVVAAVGLAMAMAGVGLGIRPSDLRRAGPRPVLFGGVLSLTVAVMGLALQVLPSPY